MKLYHFFAATAIFIITIKRDVLGFEQSLEQCYKANTTDYNERWGEPRVYLCTPCTYLTRLDPEYYKPYYFREEICSGNKGCLLNEGGCVQKAMYFEFKRYDNKSNTWDNYQQRIRSGCECRLEPDSVFRMYVAY